MEAHKVGIRDLKNHLTEWLRRVRDGDTVLVTDRGRVVAELRPTGPREDMPAGLRRLVEQGRCRPALVPNDPSLYPAMTPVGPPGLAQRLIDEGREDNGP